MSQRLCICKAKGDLSQTEWGVRAFAEVEGPFNPNFLLKTIEIQ